MIGKKETNRALLWGNYYAFLVNGIAVLMVGAILPHLLKDFHLSYALGGLLLFLQALGNLCAGLISGVIAEYFGRKAAQILGPLFHIIGFGGILLTSSPPFLMASVFISGMGWGTINNMSNLVISDATNGKAGAMNLLHMFFAIGAFIAPLMVGVFVKTYLGWHAAVIMAVIFSASLTVAFLLLPAASMKDSGRDAKRSFDFLRQPRYYLFMGIFFLYVGTENSINGWIVTYLIHSGILSEVVAQSNLSLLWVAVIFGRLLCANLGNRLSKEKIILACSLGGLFFFALFMMTRNPLLISVCMLGTGFFFAGVYPTAVANASYLITESGIASGILFSCGGLGASVVPYCAGLMADGRGLSAGVATIVLAAFLLMILVILNFRTGRKFIKDGMTDAG